jgi:hypothetical protein
MATNGNDNKKITPQQQRAIAALLSTKNVAEAASKADVGGRTLHRWIAEDAMFKAALSAAESELIDGATRRLLQYQDAAITVIASIMLDKERPSSVRLRAATAVVDYMLKLRELRNIEERLTALEEAYAAQK